MAYFDTLIEPVHNRYLSEDYMFCQWSRKIGLKIFMCPWMQMGHMGSYNFTGNIPAIAQVPGATHGGMLGDAPAKAAPANFNAPIPQATAPQAGAPVLMPPPPLGGNMNQGKEPATLQDRAARRRELAAKRRAEKKARKKKEPSKNIKGPKKSGKK